MIHYLKGGSSSHLRGISSVTFDLDDGSCEGSAAPPLARPCVPSVSAEGVEDSADQQREPNQSQIDRKTQTSFVGVVESERTEHERLNPDFENAAAGETDLPEEDVKEDEDEAEADVTHGSQDIPGGSEVDVVEEKGDANDLEPDGEPSERPRSATPPSEPPPETRCEQTCETGADPAAGEQEDQRTHDDDDVGIGEDGPEEAEELTELREEEVNPEGPDLDSSFTPSNPERLVSRKRDHRARTRESRALRYVKVLQAPEHVKA